MLTISTNSLNYSQKNVAFLALCHFVAYILTV